MKLNREYSETAFQKSVRELAHYLYVIRGCKNGRSLEYWLEAEKRLKESLASERDYQGGQPPHFSN